MSFEPARLFHDDDAAEIDRAIAGSVIAGGTLDTTPKKLVKGATLEAAVHETIHLNSSLLFQQLFGFNYNEAATEYFTLKVF